VTSPAAPANAFNEYFARYYDDDPAEGIVLFVREQLGVEPDENQIAILRAFARGERRISVRSGHRVGKSTTLAWCIVWQAVFRYPQKTVCTAPTSKQLYEALAAETKAWFNKLPPGLQALFDVKSEAIVLLSDPNESFISFRTSSAETPEALAGVHSRGWVLIIIDEASGVHEKVYESAIGSMAGHRATTILAGNPVRTTGKFFDTHNKPEVMEKWLRFHVSCINHPRITPDFIDEVKATYGEDSNAFRVRVLGEFPKGDDDTVIPYELVAAAQMRDVRPSPTVRQVWGVDVARFGSDKSALAKRKGNVLIEPCKEWAGLDVMEVSGRVKAEWDSTPLGDRPVEINVDVIGVGAGVCDRLRELGLPARGINVAESPALGDKYRNLRAELYFKGKDWFLARDCSICDDLLGAELVKARFKYSSNGKMQVESKDEMKKRGIASPNRADAFLLTLATDAITASSGTSQSTSWRTPLRRVIKGIV
jgi:phage terminase large subunit